MVLVEVNDILTHVDVPIDVFQNCWVSSEALCCLGSPVWKLTSLLKRMLVLQDKVQMLLNFRSHLVQGLGAGVLQAIDQGTIPHMLWPGHLLTWHRCVLVPNEARLPTRCAGNLLENVAIHGVGHDVPKLSC